MTRGMWLVLDDVYNCSAGQCELFAGGGGPAGGSERGCCGAGWSLCQTQAFREFLLYDLMRGKYHKQ